MSSNGEKLYCEWDHKEIVGDPIVGKMGKLYCCTLCRNNATPMTIPAHGRYAGGGQILQRGSSMRWQVTQSERIMGSEIPSMVSRWLMSRYAESPNLLNKILAMDPSERMVLADAIVKGVQKDEFW